MFFLHTMLLVWVLAVFFHGICKLAAMEKLDLSCSTGK